MQARYQADGPGQFCGLGVWAGVLAALDPAAVGRAQGGGEADPAGELAADRLPTGAQARLRQAFAQQVHAVIGEHWSIYEVSDYLGCGSYGSRVVRIHWTFAPKTPEISRSGHEGDEVGQGAMNCYNLVGG